MALIPLADNDSYPLTMQDGTVVQSRAEHMAYNAVPHEQSADSPWGTAGALTLANRASEQSDEIREAPGPDGRPWLRVGEGGANIPTGDGVWNEGDVVYDPTYGWLMNPDAAARAETAYGSPDFFDKYGVELAGLAVMAPAMFGAGAAAGTGGGSIAGAGAAEGAASGIANYSTLGLGGGTGTAVAGGAADAALLGGGAVNATAVGPYSLASGVGGGLGGSATLGAAALSPYSLGSPSTSGAGTGATTPNVGAPGAPTGTAAGGTAASALTKLLSGAEMTPADWASLGIGAAGALAPAALGYLGAGSTADTIREISAQSRADRQPSLDYYNSLLTPQGIENYYKTPEVTGSVDAILRKLSMQGNPADNPGLLGQAAAYNLGGLTNARARAAGPAFGTAGNEMNVNLAGAQAAGGQYDAIGLGLGRLLNPQPSLQDTMSKYGLTIGGMRY